MSPSSVHCLLSSCQHLLLAPAGPFVYINSDDTPPRRCCYCRITLQRPSKEVLSLASYLLFYPLFYYLWIQGSLSMSYSMDKIRWVSWMSTWTKVHDLTHYYATRISPVVSSWLRSSCSHFFFILPLRGSRLYPMGSWFAILNSNEPMGLGKKHFSPWITWNWPENNWLPIVSSLLFFEVHQAVYLPGHLRVLF